MNILMASATPPDPNSGAAGTEYQTMLALRAQGHQVDALWRGHIRQHIRHGNLHYLLELPWAYEQAITARCNKQAYDVIHVNQPYAWRAAKVHRISGRPGVFVSRSHGWEPRISKVLAPWRKQFGVPDWRFPRGLVGRPMRQVLHCYARWAAEYADGVIVSCSEDLDFIVSQYRLSEECVACIPQAPPSAFAQRPFAPMAEDRMRRLLYVGQSGFFKGSHILAEVFSRLAEHRADLTFTWCTPAFEHARCRELLAPGIRDRVVFLDWMPQEELMDLYDRHGIFVFATLSEGFGKVFLEAMARGLCVVSSNTAGMRDLIHDQQNGCLVPVGDTDEICRQVRRLQDDFGQAKQISSAAVAAARIHTWTRVAEKTVKFYEQLRDRK